MIFNEKPLHKFVTEDYNARVGMTEETESMIGRFKLELLNDNGNCLMRLLSAA